MSKSEAAQTKQRDHRGCFIKGNSQATAHDTASVGTKKSEIKAQLNRLLLGVKDEEWDEVFNTILTQARRGETAQQQLLFQYAFGKPKESVDVDMSKRTVTFIKLLTMGTEDKK